MAKSKVGIVVMDGGLFGEDGKELLNKEPTYITPEKPEKEALPSCPNCNKEMLPMFNQATGKYDLLHCRLCSIKDSLMSTPDNHPLAAPTGATIAPAFDTENAKSLVKRFNSDEENLRRLTILTILTNDADLIIFNNSEEEHQTRSILIARTVFDVLEHFGIEATPFPVNLKIYSPFAQKFIASKEQTSGFVDSDDADAQCQAEGFPVFGETKGRYVALKVEGKPFVDDKVPEGLQAAATQNVILDIALARWSNLEEAIDLPSICYPLTEAFMNAEEPLKLPPLGRIPLLDTQVFYYFAADEASVNKLSRNSEWKNSFKSRKSAVKALIDHVNKRLEVLGAAKPVEYDPEGPFGIKIYHETDK
jgi:hypothetical protein